MIKLTLADGPTDELNGASVVRIVRSIENHGNKDSKTTIHRPEVMLVKEEPAFVAGEVAKELPSLAKLTLKDGTPVWFNAKLSDGPLRLAGSEIEGGIRSALSIGGLRQRVRETHLEVAEVLRAAGKQPRSPPPDSFFANALDSLKAILGSKLDEWPD